MPRILLLATGGTIVSTAGSEGLAPGITGRGIVELIPELKDICTIECQSVLNIDSSNMQPEDWLHIARAVFAAGKDYDGVVITHGTDTMAYTAAALSFLLKNSPRPVVLTGSQIPIGRPDTDARRNIFHAFLTACSNLAGVYVVFAGKIINGTRAVKTSTVSPAGFASINVPPVGRIVRGKVLIDHYPPRLQGPFTLDDQLDSRVFLLKLVPGTPPAVFDWLLSTDCRGVVIEGYGLGGIPFLGRDLLAKVSEMVEKGVAVVVGTQCLHGETDLTVYQVGSRAAKAGVIPAYDMTTEAAVTKLMWVLGHTRDPLEIREMMLTNYHDEINRL